MSLQWMIFGQTAVLVANSSFTGTGLVHMTGGLLDGPASLGAPNTVPQVNAGGTDIAWVPAGGGVALSGLVSGGGSAIAVTGQLIPVDASGGTCMITAPAWVLGAQWGIVDARSGGSFAATGTHYCKVVSSSSNLEDVNLGGGHAPAAESDLRQPGGCTIWTGVQDAAGAQFWKVTGGW